MRHRPTHPITKPSRLSRVLWLLAFTVVASGVCGVFIAASDYLQRDAASRSKAAQVREFADIDKRVAATLKKRVDDARRAEADAKATSATYARSSVPTAATRGCDVTKPDSITVVLNKQHCFVPIDWAPSDLALVDGYQLRSEAADQLRTMLTALATAGPRIELTSAYRSYVNQQAAYSELIATKGGAAAADQFAARPGYSEHQTGLAVDFKAPGCVLECFATTPAYAWLRAHAADYGYIQRYPEGLERITGYGAEAWHWRYVGPRAAKDMKAKGIETLEAYLRVTGGDYS